MVVVSCLVRPLSHPKLITCRGNSQITNVSACKFIEIQLTVNQHGYSTIISVNCRFIQSHFTSLDVAVLFNRLDDILVIKPTVSKHSRLTVFRVPRDSMLPWWSKCHNYGFKAASLLTWETACSHLAEPGTLLKVYFLHAGCPINTVNGLKATAKSKIIQVHRQCKANAECMNCTTH